MTVYGTLGLDLYERTSQSKNARHETTHFQKANAGITLVAGAACPNQ